MKTSQYIIGVITICLMLISLSSLVADDDKSVEEINWQVISNGGTDASSANYGLRGTASQAAVGEATSTNYILRHGFWQVFAAGGGPCQGRCGNVNGDDRVNVSDAVYVINYVFIGGDPPQPVKACANVNSDDRANISDAVYLINYVFSGGEPPGDCHPGIWDAEGGDCCPF